MGDVPDFLRKDTNPKDAIGSTKLPLDLVPDSIVAGLALAFAEGALKYGRYNWRISGVRWSIYEAAAQRHRMKLNAGEWAAPDTQVPHLFSIAACYAIIEDARQCGKLIDDRPPSQPGFPATIDRYAKIFAHLKEMFKDHKPEHRTIADSVRSELEAADRGG